MTKDSPYFKAKVNDSFLQDQRYPPLKCEYLISNLSYNEFKNLLSFVAVAEHRNYQELRTKFIACTLNREFKNLNEMLNELFEINLMAGLTPEIANNYPLYKGLTGPDLAKTVYKQVLEIYENCNQGKCR